MGVVNKFIFFMLIIRLSVAQSRRDQSPNQTTKARLLRKGIIKQIHIIVKDMPTIRPMSLEIAIVFLQYQIT